MMRSINYSFPSNYTAVKKAKNPVQWKHRTYLTSTLANYYVWIYHKIAGMHADQQGATAYDSVMISSILQSQSKYNANTIGYNANFFIPCSKISATIIISNSYLCSWLYLAQKFKQYYQYYCKQKVRDSMRKHSWSVPKMQQTTHFSYTAYSRYNMHCRGHINNLYVIWNFVTKTVSKYTICVHTN